ncbi:DUF2274 domain-containing protein [Pseudogemmobacter bohemicus]|uniref:DUF2274 domain-containing protein n=1 Tax=Pseudogemmobacter bohemicus TaxID=2250708 RepID=UPI000DD3D5B3|nr:DUF2274 domain-containing protein [Pseudogemmobacter bohemicus]
MTKLNPGPPSGAKPVKITLELPATLNRDLIACAEMLARESGRPAADPMTLIMPMRDRFMATDRGLAKAWRMTRTQGGERVIC